jgi:hypothetical protein
MNREQLRHAISAASEVSGDHELYVFGSQAILGEHPDAPDAVRVSVEVDIQPKNHPERVDVVDGALGEDSPFADTHKFYVHGVSIEAAVLPRGWEGRVRPLRGAYPNEGALGLCLDLHDVAASKLAAFREKDRGYIEVLLREHLLSFPKLRSRFALIDDARLPPEKRDICERWLTATWRNLEIKRGSAGG